MEEPAPLTDDLRKELLLASERSESLVGTGRTGVDGMRDGDMIRDRVTVDRVFDVFVLLVLLLAF